MKIKVVEPVLKANRVMAEEIRRYLGSKGVKLINILGSPGAGKTQFIKRTLQQLENKEIIGVIEGDISTTFDAEELVSLGVEIVQINTKGACHLDARMIKQALEQMRLDGKKVLFVENVGNLVCPAEFPLGEDLRILVLSLTEGLHKPLKYPLAFRTSQVLILNKSDLLPHLDVNPAVIREEALSINNQMKIFQLSSLTGEGFSNWMDYFQNYLSTL
ncbi:MAG TPA: hydrogenase accessory protein HypB [bacterium]|nr:hydrogenase accessory protein HypB [bacterium]HEX67719.1 hydrogenase accessory protein HypB [bacterium]